MPCRKLDCICTEPDEKARCREAFAAWDSARLAQVVRGIERRRAVRTAGAQPLAASTAGPSGRDGGPYFTPWGNSVEGSPGERGPQATTTKEEEKEEGTWLDDQWEVRACRCKCWYCPGCCEVMGRRLVGRLIPVLETFQGLMMLTLTIDPKLFDGPEAAYRYVRDKRAVAELVRALHRRGVLHSKRYFYVIEWQRQTEMPHFHVLVDATFIPFELLCDLWGRNRPEGAPPVVGNVPEFGHVRISKPRFHSPQHAARYACKYLKKYPPQGYPEWVRKYAGQIRRFQHSRGLLPVPPRRAPEPLGPKVHGQDRKPHRPECFCSTCRGEPQRKRVRTVEQRVAACGVGAIITRRSVRMMADGELVLGKPLMVGLCPYPTAVVREWMGVDESQRVIELSPEVLRKVLDPELGRHAGEGPRAAVQRRLAIEVAA